MATARSADSAVGASESNYVNEMVAPMLILTVGYILGGMSALLVVGLTRAASRNDQSGE